MLKAALLFTGLMALGLPGTAPAKEQPQAQFVEDPQPLPLALGDNFEFLKQKLLLVTGDNYPETTEQMIRHQYDKIFYGAITRLDREARYGNYFTFFWKAREPAAVTVRLEYRQTEYGDFIQALEVPYDNAKGTMQTRFQVIGDNYREGGPVTSWRCIIIEDGKIVALTSSYLWK